MRIALFFAFLGLPVLAIGGPSGGFAKSGRILTIEQWKSPESMIWAVQDRQIVIYRRFDYVSREDLLVATKSITAEQFQAIKAAVERLPKEVYGFCHVCGHGNHAPMLRLGFRNDGSRDLRGVEVDGYFPSWIEEIVAVVSAASGPEAPITFQQAIYQYLEKTGIRNSAPDLRKIELWDRYGEQKPR